LTPANESPTPGTRAEPEARTLRLTHRLALALLVACALVIAVGAGEPQVGSPPRGYTLTAIALAVVSIGLRWVASGPRSGSRKAVHLQILGLAAASGIGVVGLVLALGEGLWKTGLFYTLAGGLLALRPPSPTPPSASPPPSGSPASDAPSSGAPASGAPPADSPAAGPSSPAPTPGAER
jgi:hypothetical protein